MKRTPLGVYGESKSKGEEYIEKLLFPNKQGIILRTSWLVSSIGRKFCENHFKTSSRKR